MDVSITVNGQTTCISLHNQDLITIYLQNENNGNSLKNSSVKTLTKDGEVIDEKNSNIKE